MEHTSFDAPSYQHAAAFPPLPDELSTAPCALRNICFIDAPQSLRLALGDENAPAMLIVFLEISTTGCLISLNHLEESHRRERF
jgi:hypothetical protein